VSRRLRPGARCHQNIENNPMQSSLGIAGMDAFSAPRENILTRRANHRHYCIITQICKNSSGKRALAIPQRALTRVDDVIE
jgi:hypothetical protein